MLFVFFFPEAGYPELLLIIALGIPLFLIRLSWAAFDKRSFSAADRSSLCLIAIAYSSVALASLASSA